ncbi:MAG: type II toxin-antitoxin system VapC family toxin [Candidatus Wallbacteria bacterium]|nr:type II toxin-antitoxin system VapC family toxin [Candidatus Wallbacteria bacterium]
MKLKLYLDTSVWNFFFADDSPDKMEITKRFFKNIQNFDIFISSVVIEEIEQSPNEKKLLLEELIKKHQPSILEINSEIRRLAKLYVAKGIIPAKSINDAIHIACSTYFGIDVLLSWNYKHLANIFKKRKVSISNLEEGYLKPLEITTPMEVITDEKE